MIITPTHMETETREGPAVAARLVANASTALADLGARLRAATPRFAITAGRGSSGAAALLAKYLFEQHLGVVTASATPSLSSVYRHRLNLADALVLVVSQSGRSPDLIDFCRAASGPGVLRIGLINEPASPLADAVDANLSLEAGPETSVAATKSCLSAMLLVFGIVAHWRNAPAMIASFNRSPDVLAKALTSDWSEAADFLDADDPLYIVGRGAGLPIAKEAALKLKETCGLFAEAYSSAELRHGPLALAGPCLRVIMFVQRDAASADLHHLAADLRAKGAPVLILSADAATGPAIPGDPEPAVELIGLLQRFYLFANAAALRRGRSPDHPPSLSKITETR